MTTGGGAAVPPLTLDYLKTVKKLNGYIFRKEYT